MLDSSFTSTEANKKTVFQYAVSSIGSFDYKAFNKELIEKLSA